MTTPLSEIAQVKRSPKANPVHHLLEKTPPNQPLELLIQKGQSLSTKQAKDNIILANQFQDKLRKPYPTSNEQIKDNFNKQSAPIHSTQAIISQTSSPKAMESKKYELTKNEFIFKPKLGGKNDSLKNSGTSSLTNNLNNYHGSHPRQFKQGSLPTQHVQNLEPTLLSARRNSKPNEQNYGSKNNLGPMGGPVLDLQDILGNFGGLGQHSVRAYQHINLNSMNNGGTLPKNGERGYSPNNLQDSGSHYSSNAQYFEMIRNLNDKNQALDLLTRERMELESKIDMLSGELKELKKMKSQINQKNQLIARLKSDLSQTLQNSTEFQSEFQRDPQFKENIENLLKSQSENDPIAKQSIQALLDRFSVLSGDEEDPTRLEEHSQSRLADKKLHLLDMLNPKNTNSIPKTQTTDAKRPGSSYLLTNTSDSRTQREPPNSQTSLAPNQLHQRNLPNTLQTNNKKKFESPYYENYMGTTKDISSKNLSSGSLKKQSDSHGNLKKSFQPQQSNSKAMANNINYKKEDLAEALRKNNVARTGSLQLRADLTLDKNLVSVPSTTSNVSTGLDALKRKFSHDPKIGGTDTGSLFPNELEHCSLLSPEENSIRKGPEKNFDVATSLNQLKERIVLVLERHRSHYVSLKRTQDLIQDKIEKLGLDLDQNPAKV